MYCSQEELLANVFSRIDEEWSGFGANVEEFLASGDKVVTLGHYSGKHKLSGKDMKAQFAHVYTLREGKIIKFQQVADSKTFAEAMT